MEQLDEGKFAAWLEGYKAAWEARDPEAAAALFTDRATYRETPFDEPFAGRDAIRDYWTGAVARQSAVTFTYEVVACARAEGVCQWHATFTGVPGGERIDLDGIFRCRFAEDGNVDRFEEWWHIRIEAA